MYAHVPSEGEASEEGTCAISDFGPSADRECGLRTADGASEEGESECGLRVRTADCERGVRGRVGEECGVMVNLSRLVLPGPYALVLRTGL